MLILTACPFKCQTYTIKWVPGAQIKKKQPLSDDVDIRDVLPSICLREYLTERKKKLGYFQSFKPDKKSNMRFKQNRKSLL